METMNDAITLSDGTIVRTKAEAVAAIRASFEPGEFDMLADLMGADFDNDPLAFFIAAEIRIYGDFESIFNSNARDEIIAGYRRKYPAATERALKLVPMSGDEFYRKYGEDEIWRRWKTVVERTGVDIHDVLPLNSEIIVKDVVQAGNQLKNRILWTMAGDWIDDMVEFGRIISTEELAKLCGEL